MTNTTGLALDSRPAPLIAASIGVQHLLAMFGGLVTAPLLVALGMGLGPSQTAYLISSALLVSGLATWLQVSRLGPIGSGLLSVQGTSFTFIGPLIYVYQSQVDVLGTDGALAVVFGACAVCSLIMVLLAQFIVKLRNVLTPSVTGTTILLLGITLVWATLGNLRREFAAAAEPWLVAGVATGVFGLIVLLSRSSQPAIRMSSIMIGLVAGSLIAWPLGMVELPPASGDAAWFVPRLAPFGMQFDLAAVLILLPIFVVSATESVGDLTATASLSGLKVGDGPFWRRIRGGIVADSVNSFAAACVATFPNTTFSQNNGVIRLTGVSSRYVGFYVAGFLVLLGLLPVVARVVQGLPGAALYGATLLMFLMVGISGYKIVAERAAGLRDWIVVAISVAGGLACGWIVPQLGLPEALASVLSFPVSSGAFIALVLELSVPKSPRGHRT